MATSPIYSWPEPDNTDLVKNGALSIRTLGNAIDTTMATMTPKSLVDAKGDLIAASANDTPARLAVGNNGETLVADSSTSTGLRYQPTNAAGKNCIINGGMDIFQRTTSTGFNAYALDRWYIGSSGGVTTTQSTAKTTPNSQYMMLMTAQSTQQIFAYQAVETRNAIYYAGKTVTLSAYAAGLTTTTNLIMVLSYSTSVDNSVTGSWTDISPTGGNANLTLSSTVTRWSATYDVPSTAKSLRVLFVNNAANITVGQGIYLGDVQLEVGSVTTAFSRAGGTIQGELAACQRYYEKSYDQATAPATANVAVGLCMFSITSVANGAKYGFVKFAATKRVAPTVTIYGYQGGAGKVSTDTTGADQAANSGNASQIGQGSFAIGNVSGSTVTTTNGTSCHFVAEAEL